MCLQIVKMTDDEKLTMYMKCSKKELAKIIIANEKYRSSPQVSVIDISAWPSSWESGL